jgi:hypothetical protein
VRKLPTEEDPTVANLEGSARPGIFSNSPRPGMHSRPNEPPPQPDNGGRTTEESADVLEGQQGGQTQNNNRWRN